MCVFLPHMQLLGALLNQRGKKEQMWPVHSGREKKELIGSCGEAEGLGACKIGKWGKKQGKKEKEMIYRKKSKQNMKTGLRFHQFFSR